MISVTNREAFVSSLRLKPVIAAVRSADDAVRAASSQAATVFLLGSSIMTLGETVESLKAAGKTVFVHMDLCDGLGKDTQAVAWCARYIRPDGLISTRSQLLRNAAEMGMMTIQRIFLVDSSSLAGGIRHIKAAPPDLVEVLPGLVPKAIARLKTELGIPLIAGGMVTDPGDVAQALKAGACAVSTSEASLWSWRA